MLLNIVWSPSGIIGLSGRTGVRQLPGQFGDDRAQGDDRVLQRVHPHGVLPSELVRVGRRDDVVPRDPVEHLDVVQVEVDRVGVHAVVGDPPDLRPVRRAGDRGDLHVADWAPVRVVRDVVLRQVRRVDQLGLRVDERVQGDVLQARFRRLGLDARGSPSSGRTRRTSSSSSRRGWPSVRTSSPSSRSGASAC